MTLPTRSMRALTVLFLHPTESFLNDFHTERARSMGVKYAKAAYVQTGEGIAVKTKLVLFQGRPVTRMIEGLPQEPETLLNALVASIDDRYSTIAEETEQQGYQERLHV